MHSLPNTTFQSTDLTSSLFPNAVPSLDLPEIENENTKPKTPKSNLTARGAHEGAR
jgi:hypothetical protein